MSAAARKALCGLLRDASRRRHLWDVFGDFVEVAALALANAVPGAFRPEREEQYHRTMARYDDAERALFPRMFAELVNGLSDETSDLLGTVFGELDLGNAARGQFFTPYHVCRLMADLTIDEKVEAEVARKGFITVQEPAVGAGAMIIAMAEAMRARGMEPQRCLHVTAVDVDPRAAHMAFVQLCLLHIPAVVVVGNTLTLETRETFHTFAHVLDLWPQKLRRGCALGTPDAAELGFEPSIPKFRSPANGELIPALVPVVSAGAQLSLFGEHLA